MPRAIHVALAIIAALLYNGACNRFPTGTIAGTVRDRSGAPIADGAVGVVGLARMGPIDTSGRYRLPSIPVGTHRLRAAVAGYALLERDSVVVRRGATTVVDFTLDRMWTSTSLRSPRPPVRRRRSLGA